MSTILKALRRLEREKAIAPEGRSLQETVATGGSPESGNNRTWLTPGIALLLGVAVGAGLLLLWPEPAVEAVNPPPVSAGATPPEFAEAPPPRLPEPVELRRPLPAIYEVETLDEGTVELEESGPPPGVFSSPVAVVKRPARQPRIAAAPPPAPVPALAPEEPAERIVAQAVAPAASHPSAEERYAPPPARTVARPELPATTLPEPPIPADPFPEPALAEPPVAPPEVRQRRSAEPQPRQPEIAEPKSVRESPTPKPAAAAAATATERPPTQDAAVRRVEEGPRDAFPAAVGDPAIRVERTWWHPTPERREAQLRLDGGVPQRRKEGEFVGDARVTRIEPSGVIFTRNDREFRRGVGGGD